MKRYLPALLTLVVLALTVPASLFAQGPPSWAPAHGYRNKQQPRYYYIPEARSYYDCTKGVFISLGGNGWNVSANLPMPYVGFSLNTATVVALDFTGDRPQAQYSTHSSRYPVTYVDPAQPNRGPKKDKGVPPGQAKKQGGGPGKGGPKGKGRG